MPDCLEATLKVTPSLLTPAGVPAAKTTLALGRRTWSKIGVGVPAAWHRQQSHPHPHPPQTANNPSDSHWLVVRWEC
ncbi:hypothetical protein [Haloquadratum walsbyi]|uniref:hypothetical protein n=1 Tax=Haloquadratum walsbyi TaxID=293091 RepID=UPI00117FF3B5|nr:hypothetical protein [Haloquadratum walsbyi]